MNPIVGKTYKTRSGATARILCVDRRGTKPVIALVNYDDRENIVSYFPNCRIHGNLVEHEWDLLPNKRQCISIFTLDPI